MSHYNPALSAALRRISILYRCAADLQQGRRYWLVYDGLDWSYLNDDDDMGASDDDGWDAPLDGEEESWTK
jgi:hypothetical protein